MPLFADPCGAEGESAYPSKTIDAGQIIGEGVGVKVDECAEQHTKLCCIQDGWGILKDAVEGGLAAFDDFGSEIVLGLNLRLLPLELLFALLLPTLAFFLVLRSLPLELGFTLCGLFLRLGFLRRWHRRHGVGGCFGGGLRVMHGAMLVRTNCQLTPKLLAVDHDCGPGCLAWQYRLGVGIVDHVWNLPNMAALHRSGSLLFGIAPAILDLDESGMGGNLPV